MKRTRKFLSLLLTLCMTLSLVTGLTASAEDAATTALNLVSYDADSDFIKLAFDEEIDIATANISLTKGDKAVNFELKENYIMTGVKKYATYSNYYIIPENGIELGAEYKLSLNEVKNTDGTAILSNWEKFFIVNDLGGELEQLRASTTGTNMTYTANDDGSDTFAVNELNPKYDEVKTGYLATGVGADYLNPSFTPVNNCDKTLSTYGGGKTTPEPVTEMDYTFKVKYEITGMSTGHFGLGITDNVNRFFKLNSTVAQGAYFYLQIQPGSTASWATLMDYSSKASILKKDANGTQINMTDKYKAFNGNTVMLSGVKKSGFELKISTKDDLLYGYIDGKLVSDQKLSRKYRGYAMVEGEFIKSTNSAAPYGTIKVSDFLATRSTWTDETTIIPTPLLKSYDADTDFITLNFDKAVNITKDNIILSADGAAIPVTVASANHNNLKATNSTVNTYLVKPANGKIEVNKEYKLTLTNISDTEEKETLTSWAKAFTVAELAKGLKLPEDANDKKMSYKANSSSYTVSNVNEDELKVQYNGTAEDAIFVYKAVGNDDGTTFAEKDYTVKAVLKDVANTPYANFGVAIASSKGYTFNHGQFRGTGMRMQVQPLKASDLTQGIGKYANMYIYSRTADANASKEQGAADIYGNDVAKGVEMKLAIKEGQVIGFINGKKIVDMPLYSYDEQGNIVYYYDDAGMAKMYFAPKSSDGAVATIADFIATRATWKNATPDTKVEMVDWDADSDFVTLDFNEEINISEANVTLTNAGVTVPVTVGLANHKNMKSANSERYTYIVKPVSGGIALDIPYTINVAGITAKNDENSKFEGFTKTFKVEKLAEGLQLADGSKVMKYQDRSVFNISNVNTDDIKADYTAESSSRVQLYRAVGKDKEIKASYVGTNPPYVEKDYTVKTTFKNISGTSHADMVLAISYSYDSSYGSDHNYFRGVSLRSTVQPKDSTNTAVGTNTNMTFHNINGYDADTKTKSQILKTQDSSIKGVDVVNGVELKISTKNKFAHAFIDGAKVGDMQLLQDYAGFAQIHFSPRNTTTENLATVTIADFLATRAVEVTETLPEFTVSDLTVTADGEAVESITGKTAINVSAELTNNTLAEKDVYITCAVYTASGEMKNCVVSEVKKAGAGKTPVNFEDVAVNGGDKVKVFIWDGLDSLGAYFSALTFPAE